MNTFHAPLIEQSRSSQSVTPRRLNQAGHALSLRADVKTADELIKDYVPLQIARLVPCVPLDWQRDRLHLGVPVTLADCELELLSWSLDVPLDPVRLDEAEIWRTLETIYGIGVQCDPQSVEVQSLTRATSLPTEHEAPEGSGPAVQLLNDLVAHAIESRATDVHLEPQAGEWSARWRVDGVLHPVPLAADVQSLYTPLVVRIKMLADLDIGEQRLPQDGRLRMMAHGSVHEVRVSTLPSAHGESVSLRLMNQQELGTLESLGWEDEDVDWMRWQLRRTHGLLLVAGPTGSGKTTTLYASLRELCSGTLKVLTVEDPVEHALPGVTQIQIRPEAGLTFARALRSMLRHDPDVMLVGEIRDQDTAETAIRLALTGHLVLSSIHTTDAVETVTRFVDMGIEPYLLGSALLGVVAQRLVRLNCQRCRASSMAHKVQDWPKHGDLLMAQQIDECSQCSRTGVFGRSAICERLTLDDSIRSAILARQDADTLREMARNQGMVELKDRLTQRIERGEVSPQEALRCL